MLPRINIFQCIVLVKCQGKEKWKKCEKVYKHTYENKSVIHMLREVTALIELSDLAIQAVVFADALVR